MMNNGAHQSSNSPQDSAFLTQEMQTLVRKLRRAYPHREPSPEFRQALYARLMVEAQRLKAQPAHEPRGSLVGRAVVGAAALSVAGLAFVMWRSRLASTMLSRKSSFIRPMAPLWNR